MQKTHNLKKGDIFNDRWEIIEEIPGGGQGKVYRVLDKSKIDRDLLTRTENALSALLRASEYQTKKRGFEAFKFIISELIRMKDSTNHGALKVLQDPKDARDPVRAEERIKGEIQTMAQLDHPNLLKIIEYSLDQKWFVSEFHYKGSLSKNKNRFIGDLIGALRAFRLLVEGVCEIHKIDKVHRDIKPANVFLGSDDNLVLGDFGLVYDRDSQRLRISGTWENVGSRDWMPPWASGRRIDEVKPTFDVFGLGKLLWAMVSGKPLLPLWYFNDPEHPEFNLEKIFPNDPLMKWANHFFSKCVVEKEKDCLPNANALLEEIDKLLPIVERRPELIDSNVKEFPCKICGIGIYKPYSGYHRLGIEERRIPWMKIFVCDYCGNIQYFFNKIKEPPEAWKPKP